MAHDTELNVYQHTAKQIMNKMRQYEKDMKERAALLQLFDSYKEHSTTATTSTSDTPSSQQSSSLPSTSQPTSAFVASLPPAVRAAIPNQADDVHALPTALVSKISKIRSKRSAQERYRLRKEQEEALLKQTDSQELSENLEHPDQTIQD